MKEETEKWWRSKGKSVRQTISEVHENENVTGSNRCERTVESDEGLGKNVRHKPEKDSEQMCKIRKLRKRLKKMAKMLLD